MRAGGIAVLSLACLAASCGGEPVVSDTGYTGTWTRGTDRARSTVSIVPDGDGYRFRVEISTDDDSRTMTCDWDGRCEEVVGGRPVADHRFTTSVDPDSGHLIVACEVRRADDGEVLDRFVDELVVESGGRVLQVYTIERKGEPLKRGFGGKRTFEKISDEVASPPESSGDDSRS